ncbi:hypothetical protein [Granulicoccus sp. GXG6511]|uniref:hypothetical protein n=1 Tax=Granulicoccus sp. GXG6511 TaxID=3381351 RepID=UPI003D7D204A
MSSVRAVGRVLRFIGARVLGDPIAAGSLRENPAHPWPTGLRPIIFATWVLFVVLAGLAVMAGALRRTPIVADGTTSLPWIAVPVLALAVTTALALLFTAALHVWWVVRVPLLLLIALTLAAAPVADTTLRLVHQLGVVALLVFAIARWRARFAFFEFVVALTVIGHSLLLQLAGPLVIAYAVESWPLQVLLYWLKLLTVLAVPAALLAAAAMTELVVTTGSWTARGVWEGLRRRTHTRWPGRALLAVLVVWAVSAEVWAIATNPRRSISTFPVALLILAVTALVALLVLRQAPRGARPAVDPDDVAAAYSPISWPLALILTAWMFHSVPLTLIGSLLAIPLVDGDPGKVVMLFIYAAAGLAVAVHAARRNHVGRALIATVFAVVTPAAQLLLLGGWGTAGNQLVAVEVAAAVLLLGWLLARRQLTADRALALGTVLLLSRIHDFREVLDDPLSALLALSGASAVLLVGLVWRQLTEYAAARGHSPRFPNSGRVMLALANMTLVTLSVATFALSAGDAGIVSLGIIEAIGDSELGGSLLHASMIAGLLLALRGRAGGEAGVVRDRELSGHDVVRLGAFRAYASDPPNGSDRDGSDWVVGVSGTDPPHASEVERADPTPEDRPRQG